MSRVLLPIKFIVSCLFFLGRPADGLAQLPLDVCEGEVPVQWQTKDGGLSLSGRHFKTGKEAVRWDWKRNDAVLQIKDTAFESVAANPRSSFVLWIYNERPLKDSLLFSFKKGGRTAAFFYFHLNFKGWRTAWVMYHRDMKGSPLAGMNMLTIQAPRSANAGSLYFDQVLPNVSVNPRSPMQDYQVPMVNINAHKAANAHWTALYRFSQTPHWQLLPLTLTERDKQSIQLITRRFEKILFPAGNTHTRQQLEDAFRHWKIRRTRGNITGRPVYSMNDIELVRGLPAAAAKNAMKPFSVKTYTELMLKVASAHEATGDAREKSRLGTLFIDLLDHLEDQGWTAGSGMGALHHLGYNFRDYYTSCLMMKPLLKKKARLQRTVQSMAWFSGLGRTQALPDSLTDSNIDVFNTLLAGMLSTVLLMDDSPAKVRQLQAFSAWLSKALEPTLSIDGTFKPDGAVVHHGNLYPAYGVGGLEGVAPIVYVLSQTPFRIKEKGHQTVRHVLLTMHRYTNPYRWPISVSGRHPTGNWAIADDPFAYLALAGTPDGSRPVDDSLAAIYLLLNPEKKNAWTRHFEQAGIKSATFPTGHWNINYGLLSMHRRSKWLLTVRGHNRYFTTHEAYPGANVFGRYLTFGHLEINFPQSEKGGDSHFKDEGWDWNSLPGTTTLKVPLDHLRARIINADDQSGVEEMLLSDEIFAGGINFNQRQGAFAMKLHGHDKYNMGSFRAIKSWFMFDSLVVCLGSNITNTIQDFPTVTTLFQNVLDSSGSPPYLQNGSNTVFPMEKQWSDDKPLTVMDNRGIRYYLPQARSVQLSRKVQQSRNQQDTKNTQGEVALLQLNHGRAPQNSSYEYAMMICAQPERLKDLQIDRQAAAAPYRVVQKDSIAHIVYYAPQQLTALALFAFGKPISDSFVVMNNRPCLLMYRRETNRVALSVVDPDLAFYTGPDDSPLTPEGKRKEVSIYSRTWYSTPSQPSVVQLEVQGKWKLENNTKGILASLLPNGHTKLVVPCTYGLTTELNLIREDKISHDEKKHPSTK